MTLNLWRNRMVYPASFHATSIPRGRARWQGSGRQARCASCALRATGSRRTARSFTSDKKKWWPPQRIAQALPRTSGDEAPGTLASRLAPLPAGGNSFYARFGAQSIRVQRPWFLSQATCWKSALRPSQLLSCTENHVFRLLRTQPVGGVGFQFDFLQLSPSH